MTIKPLHGRQLFIDRALVAKAQNLTFTVNPPRKEGRAISPDRPWDASSACHSTTVLDGDEARLYYAGVDNNGRSFLCLALSRDGLQWQKPELGIFDYNGSRQNNILFEAKGITGTVIPDPAAAPEQRYKFLNAGNLEGASIYVSADGFHFRKLDVELMPFYLDNQICGFKDDARNQYLVYMRGWSPPDQNYRWIGYRNIALATLDDLTTPWPYNRAAPLRRMGDSALPFVDGQFPCVMARDEKDPPPLDIYNISAVKYPFAEGVYLGFPTVYYRFPFPPEGEFKNNGILEIQLAVSRDGCAWHRFRTPYIGGGIFGEGDWARLHMGVGMIARGNYLLQYYRGVNVVHGHGRTGTDKVVPLPPESDPAQCLGLGIVSQRKDGFVSLDTDYRGGLLLTKPFICQGQQLLVNVNTGVCGDLKIAVVTAANQPVAGFSATDCDQIKGNFVDKLVTWKGNADLAGLTGKKIRLKLAMHSLKLYSFTLT